MSPVIDLVIRIKNGYMARKETIEASYSKFGEAVLNKLQKLGFVKRYTVEGDVIKTITIDLAYEDGEPAMMDVRIISKPGQRIYTGSKDLKPVMSGLGYGIVSTPQGIMTNIEAKKKNAGGELLFYIW
jgi:small subunit ribosomal protein S8